MIRLAIAVVAAASLNTTTTRTRMRTIYTVHAPALAEPSSKPFSKEFPVAVAAFESRISQDDTIIVVVALLLSPPRKRV